MEKIVIVQFYLRTFNIWCVVYFESQTDVLKFLRISWNVHHVRNTFQGIGSFGKPIPIAQKVTEGNLGNLHCCSSRSSQAKLFPEYPRITFSSWMTRWCPLGSRPKLPLLEMDHSTTQKSENFRDLTHVRAYCVHRCRLHAYMQDGYTYFECVYIYI